MIASKNRKSGYNPELEESGLTSALTESISRKRTGKYVTWRELTPESTAEEFLLAVQDAEFQEVDADEIAVPDDYNIPRFISKRCDRTDRAQYCYVRNIIGTSRLFVCSKELVTTLLRFGKKSELEEIDQYEYDDHYDEVNCTKSVVGSRLLKAVDDLKDTLSRNI